MTLKLRHIQVNFGGVIGTISLAKWFDFFLNKKVPLYDFEIQFLIYDIAVPNLINLKVT